jgi:hypothetical protein
MKKFIIPIFCLATAFAAQAQNGARLFLDLPSIYLTAPNVEKVGNLLGAGAETAFNVGTHWCNARIGGGAVFSLDPKSNDLGASFLTSPYALTEVGLGRYRSNGNQCAKTHQSAFTAMVKGGVRYDFQAKKIDYTVGGELAYFFIRDMFKNTEVFLDARYHTQAEAVAVNFGVKFFLNLKARRDY